MAAAKAPPAGGLQGDGSRDLRHEFQASRDLESHPQVLLQHWRMAREIALQQFGGGGQLQLQLHTHDGTHLDAPHHFASTMDGGQPALTIDEVDLNWCFQPGVKLDFCALPDGHVVQPADVEAELKRIGHVLKPVDIVLVDTRAGVAHGRPEYTRAGCGMGLEATLYLLVRGVRLTGTDAWRWDAPFAHTSAPMHTRS